jgi:hypothetical protein
MTNTTPQTAKANYEYTPGVCNIGPAERARRRQTGIIATIVTIVLLVILVATDASPYWRLILFLPATIAASGFLQDAFHFCAAFGVRGIYNVVNSAGITDNVDLEEYRRKDRNKALMITGLSGLIGAVVVGLSLYI